MARRRLCGEHAEGPTGQNYRQNATHDKTVLLSSLTWAFPCEIFMQEANARLPASLPGTLSGCLLSWLLSLPAATRQFVSNPFNKGIAK